MHRFRFSLFQLMLFVAMLAILFAACQRSLKSIRLDTTGYSLNKLAFSPDGSSLAAAITESDQGTFTECVELIDTQSGETRRAFTVTNNLPQGSAFAFSPDGKTLAVAVNRSRPASVTPHVELLDAQTAKTRFTLDGHLSSVTGVSFSSNGRRIATSSADMTVRTWDAETGQLVQTFPARPVAPVQVQPADLFPLALSDGPGPIEDVRYREDDRIVALSNRCVLRWDEQSGRLEDIHQHPEWVVPQSVSSDGSGVVALDVPLCGSGPRTLSLWNPATGNVRNVLLSGHFVMTTSPDGRFLAVRDYGYIEEPNQEIEIWDVAAGTKRPVPADPPLRGVPLAFGPDNKSFVLFSLQSSVQIWDIDKGQLRADIPSQTTDQWGYSAALSPDGNALAVGDSGGALQLMDLQTQHHRVIHPRRAPTAEERSDLAPVVPILGALLLWTVACAWLFTARQPDRRLPMDSTTPSASTP